MTVLNVRPVLLVVHGALGSGAQMEPLADACRASNAFAAVDVLELPGHGNTPLGDAAFSMPRFAEVIRARVSQCASAHNAPGHNASAHNAAGHNAREHDAPVVIFGYSMGGYAALLAEATHPGLCAGIVTLGTMVTWSPEIAEGAARRLDVQGIRTKVPAFAQVLEARHANAGGLELTLARTAALLRGLGASPSLTPDVCAKVRAPVLLMVGTKDDSVTLAQSDAMAATMSRASAVELPDVPHPIEKVPLDLLVSRLTGFVSSLTRE